MRAAQKKLYAQWSLLVRRRFRPKFDDVEAELTYLLVRTLRPAVVLEIAPYYGWSTTWLLQALKGNGAGQLHSYDIIDHSRRNVPADLAQGRWHFTLGDVRNTLTAIPGDVGYLFLDAAHTAEFARWYLEDLFPRLRAGTPVGVHDVFRGPDLPPMEESVVLLEWLERRRVPYFTAAPSRSRETYDRIVALKRELGLAEPIHDSIKNPMVFFRLP